jgi:hypothetical protein
MVRILLREHYVPMARPGAGAAASVAARPEPFVPPRLAQHIRATGTVPFALAVSVYFPDTRVRYEIDLLDGSLVLDPRAHRLPVVRQQKRSARVGYAVDALVARGELSLPSARALEALVETNGLSAVDVAPLFGGVRELGASALDSLVARRLASFDRRSGVDRARLEALAGAPERRRAPASAPAVRSNPRLRSSVMELIAAAESRASCPLCGEPLPSGHTGLLCDKCQALVGPAGPPHPA